MNAVSICLLARFFLKKKTNYVRSNCSEEWQLCVFVSERAKPNGSWLVICVAIFNSIYAPIIFPLFNERLLKHTANNPLTPDEPDKVYRKEQSLLAAAVAVCKLIYLNQRVCALAARLCKSVQIYIAIIYYDIGGIQSGFFLLSRSLVSFM